MEIAYAACVLNGETVPCSSFGHAAGWIFSFGLVGMIVFFLALIFWVWMMVHAIKHPIQNKAVWIIIMIITGFIGAIVYYFVVKREFDKNTIPTPSVPPLTPPSTPVSTTPLE